VNHVLLADFLTCASRKHRFVELFKELEFSDFLTTVDSESDFASALVSNHLGQAAKSVSEDDASALLKVINTYDRYAVVSSVQGIDSYTRVTVPADRIRELTSSEE
jgi:hypothetical protein